MRLHPLRLLFVAFFILAGVSTSFSYAQLLPTWGGQFGFDGQVSDMQMAVNGVDEVYVSGTIFEGFNLFTPGPLPGALPGFENFGGSDYFIARLNSDGDVVWMQQFGTAFDDTNGGMTVDPFGDVIVTTNRGPFAATVEVRRFNKFGRVAFSTRMPSTKCLRSTCVVTDHIGNIFVAGNADGDESFIGKMNRDGELLWIDVFPFDGEISDITVDPVGDPLIGGRRRDIRRRHRVHLIKYDSTDGDILWERGFEPHAITIRESVGGVASDRFGNFFVAGTTEALGRFNGPLGPTTRRIGGDDAYLMKYNNQGDFQWVQQFGTRSHDSGTDVVVGLDDSIMVSGVVGDDFVRLSRGRPDSHITRFAQDGSLLNARQIGISISHTSASNLSVGLDGSVYAAGRTEANLFNRAYHPTGNRSVGHPVLNVGILDVFAVKMGPELQEGTAIYDMSVTRGFHEFGERADLIRSDDVGLVIRRQSLPVDDDPISVIFFGAYGQGESTSLSINVESKLIAKGSVNQIVELQTANTLDWEIVDERRVFASDGDTALNIVIRPLLRYSFLGRTEGRIRYTDPEGTQNPWRIEIDQFGFSN